MKGKIISSERTLFSGLKLTWTQSLVCRVFKIEPLLKYFHKFKVVLDGPVPTNYLVMTNDGNMWHTSVTNEGVEFISLETIPEVKNLTGEYMILATSTNEFNQ